MDRSTFFSLIRKSLFSGKMAQGQVDGIEAILLACERAGVSDLRYIANVLAQCYHETGGQMLPVKETVYASSTDRNPSDAEVIRRLDAAFRAGKLPWVKTVYWRSGWFGRGLIQITHEDNYRRVGQAIGVDLVANRDLALSLGVAATIAVVGMRDGLFTRQKLADFFNDKSDAPAAARAIVNGDVKAIGPAIARYHSAFLAALKAAPAAAPAAPVAPVDPVAAWLAAAPANIDSIRAWLASAPEGASL